MGKKIDTDPHCDVCAEATATPHAYQAPTEEDGSDAVLTGACQFELPSGHLCGDEELKPQHLHARVASLRGTGYLESDWDWQQAFDAGIDAALDEIDRHLR